MNSHEETILQSNEGILRLLQIACSRPKGQLNWEWIYEVIVSPKMQTKNYKDFVRISTLASKMGQI